MRAEPPDQFTQRIWQLLTDATDSPLSREQLSFPLRHRWESAALALTMWCACRQTTHLKPKPGVAA